MDLKLLDIHKIVTNMCRNPMNFESFDFDEMENKIKENRTFDKCSIDFLCSKSMIYANQFSSMYAFYAT